MIFLALVAFVGGAASVLTPCVLPVLPALLAVSGEGGRRRVLGIVVGLELSFFLIGIVLAAGVTAAGLPASSLQWVAAALLGLFALTLVVPALHDRFQKVASALSRPVAGSTTRRTGFAGGFLAGAPLGLIWTPCAGPILAGITVAGASSRFSGRVVLTMVAYGLGMLGPLLAICIGGRRATAFLRRKAGSGRRVELAMGGVLLATAAVVAFGWLNPINRFLAETVNLTSTPTAALERRALERRAGYTGAGRVRVSDEELAAAGYPELDELADYGPAPELAGISDWFNSEPLSSAALRGKVVLIDFWTYSCINCIRTFPYLKQWHEDYADDGLVVLGVHTPEFEFEKDPGNVGRAVDDFGIEYPVALDPEYATWERFSNHYWPAHYLIDRDGVLRSVHYGEGGYARTENEIRHLLSLPETAEGGDEGSAFTPRTPETYLGYLRAERFAGVIGDEGYGLAQDQAATYAAPPPEELPLDAWSYSGTWTVGGESATAGEDAAILLHYVGRDVHMVAGPGEGSSGGGITVTSPGGREKTIEVDGHRLYTLRSGDFADDVLTIEVTEGIEVYSFTFG